MVTPADKLAASLVVLKKLQDTGRVAIQPEYMAGLERASVEGDTRPFSKFLVGLLRTSPKIQVPRQLRQS